ncbi:helix-turn-helix domain-containing protein [uncultured Bartonella sp.]|uniref:MerR family transcriptional regulator n=1 Tax=uncultured Bartonella sp. TaxID=104108 RepID=UPI00262FEE1A|nr:helix-turn-helix domain-containing protein [uncultured Bartonella sp.]
MKKVYFSIGELSKNSGCNIETIRYYGKIGLLDEAERTEGNQRRYVESDYKRLLFILRARNLGFSIDAIRQLIKLSRHPDDPCGQADTIAHKQLAETRAKIARLKILEEELAKITKPCKGHKVHECKVIESLADSTLPHT